MVEVELSDTNVNTYLLVAFSVVTTILVATHLFALMVSTCILPRIATTLSNKPSSENLAKSPHNHVQFYIEMAWIFRCVFNCGDDNFSPVLWEHRFPFPFSFNFL